MIPFVVLLVGNYVVEIVNEILIALPKLDCVAHSGFCPKKPPRHASHAVSGDKLLGQALSLPISRQQHISRSSGSEAVGDVGTLIDRPLSPISNKTRFFIAKNS